MRPIAASIAGTRRVVTSGTPEGGAFWTIKCTVTTKGTFVVIVTFQRHFVDGANKNDSPFF